MVGWTWNLRHRNRMLGEGVHFIVVLRSMRWIWVDVIQQKQDNPPVELSKARLIDVDGEIWAGAVVYRVL